MLKLKVDPSGIYAQERPDQENSRLVSKPAINAHRVS